MKDLSKTVQKGKKKKEKVPFWWWLVAKKTFCNVTYTHWLRTLPHNSAQAGNKLFEMFEYDIATNRVNYAQSTSFGK